LQQDLTAGPDDGAAQFSRVDNRLAALSKQAILEVIHGLYRGRIFRAEIEAVVPTRMATRRAASGRKPIDALVMFRMLVVQSLYNLRTRGRVSGGATACRHAVLRWHRGSHSRRHDAVAVRREIGEGGLIEKLLASAYEAGVHPSAPRWWTARDA